MLALARQRRSLLRSDTSVFTASSSPSSLRFLTGIANGSHRNQREHGKSPLLSSTPAFVAATRHAPLFRPITPTKLPLNMVVFPFQARGFAQRRGRNPWEFNRPHGGDWLGTVKTGALLAVGAGAVVAFASVGFGFMMFTAAGYGAYKLYEKFVAPFRSNTRHKDPFGAVQDEIDQLFRKNRTASPRSTTSTTTKSDGNTDLDSLLEGLPFMVRGIVKTFSGVISGALQSSMARAGELRRLANEYLRADTRIGSNVRISTPQNWSEYTVNGVGQVEAVFPVVDGGYATAQVDVKASIGSNGQLTLMELKYRDYRTGQVLDLLRDAPPMSKSRKTVVDAEYVDRN